MSSSLLLSPIRLAGLAAVLVLARGCAGEEGADRGARAAKSGGAERTVRRPAAPDVDGTWVAVTIDGRAVPSRGWRIGVAGGKVSGGRDGCNDWGFDAPETEGGERTIVSTLVGCPEDDPLRRAYWAVAMAGDAVLEPMRDGTLRLAAGGHEAIFRRCRWTGQPLPPGVAGTGPRICE